MRWNGKCVCEMFTRCLIWMRFFDISPRVLSAMTGQDRTAMT